MPAPFERILLLLAASATLLVGGCSSGEPSDASDKSNPSESRKSDKKESTKTATVDGISFDVPEGFTSLEASELVEGHHGNAQTAELADRLGVTEDEFMQIMGSIDLMLFSDAGASGGFLTNINVISERARMPNDSQLRLQLLQLGADVDRITRVYTDVGEVAVTEYSLALPGQPEIEGRGIMVPTSSGTVTITVSTPDTGVSDQLADQVVDTLEAS